MAKKQRQRLTKKEQLQRIFHEYMHEFNTNEIDPDHLTEWAISTGRMTDGGSSFHARCKRDLTKAMRDEHRVDPQGREVRTMHAVRIKNENGVQKSLWFDYIEADQSKMHLSLSQQRRGILAHCRQHNVVTQSYNDNNKTGGQLELWDYNFNPDLQEESMGTDYPDSPPDES